MKKYSSLLLLIFATLKLSAQTSGYFMNKGARIYYETIGKGDPIIFLHGGPGLNHTYLMPWFNALSKTHTLVFFDQRACGRSAKNILKSDVTLQNTIDDIDALRKMLKMDKVTVIAHSFGCLLAVKYAEDYARNVKSIILLNPVPLSKEYEKANQELEEKNTDESTKKKVDSIIHTAAFKSGNPAAYADLYKQSFKPVFHDKKFSEKFSITMEAGVDTDRLKLFNMTPELTDYNFYYKLNTIECPVLIVNGKYDLIAIDSQLRIKKGINNCEWMVMNKSGHFPFIEQQDKLMYLINDFLGRHNL